MRKVVPTTKFNRDFKRAVKTVTFKKNKAKFDKYVNMLMSGEKLPPESKNHPLAKHSPEEYHGCWDFHVAPDICVVYRMKEDTFELIRIGQHNDLGLTENFE